jgi:hypothetical protein
VNAQSSDGSLGNVIFAGPLKIKDFDWVLSSMDFNDLGREFFLRLIKVSQKHLCLKGCTSNHNFELLLNLSPFDPYLF